MFSSLKAFLNRLRIFSPNSISDTNRISVSTGSACTAGTVQPSHVLAAYYGEASSRLKESIRISLSEFNTTAEVDTFITTIHKILGELHGI